MNGFVSSKEIIKDDNDITRFNKIGDPELDSILDNFR